MNTAHRSLGYAGAAAASLAVLTPAVAFAHPAGLTAPGGLVGGLTHPLTGLDHLLALSAVGIWGGIRGGRSASRLAVAFLVAMATGMGIAWLGIRLPAVEPMILASALSLGLLAALESRMPDIAAVALVAVFAVFHGHVHGVEMPLSGSHFLWSAGVLTSSATIMAVTAAGTIGLRRYGALLVPRGIAAGIVAVAAVLAVGV